MFRDFLMVSASTRIVFTMSSELGVFATYDWKFKSKRLQVIDSFPFTNPLIEPDPRNKFSLKI